MLASGSFFYSMKKYLNERRSKDDWELFLAHLEPGSKEFFKSTILSSEKYNVKYAQEGFEIIKELFGKDELIRLADFAASNEIKGFVGFVFKFMSYEKFLQKVDTYIKKLYDRGDVEYEKVDKKRYILHFSNFETSDLHLFFMAVLFRRFVEKISKHSFKESINRIDQTHVDFILVRNV